METLNLSGYQPYTEVLAQRSSRGAARQTYVISLPLYLIGTYLPIPDPDHPVLGNRRVNKRHAEEFGKYWRDNSNWVTPPLLVDTTSPLEKDFEPKFAAGGVEFGVLKLRQNSAGQFEILDGQHRILGWKLTGEKLAEELKSYRNHLLATAEEDTEERDKWEARIEEVEAAQQRYESEYVTVEILHGLTEADHRQAFNDIATNALGITKSVTVSFDQRSIINRVAISAEGNIDLLNGRIDWEKDRVLSKNEHLLSGRNLADIVRHIAVGINGRVTKRRESELDENSVYSLTDLFFTALVDGFHQFKDVETDDVFIPELRERGMLLSPTVLRVLAGTFHNLAVDSDDAKFLRLDQSGYQKTLKLFGKLSQEVEYPLDPRWYNTGVFPEDAKLPGSRAQDLTKLTNILTEWGRQGEIFVPTKTSGKDDQ